MIATDLPTAPAAEGELVPLVGSERPTWQADQPRTGSVSRADLQAAYDASKRVAARHRLANLLVSGAEQTPVSLLGVRGRATTVVPVDRSMRCLAAVQTGSALRTGLRVSSFSAPVGTGPAPADRRRAASIVAALAPPSRPSRPRRRSGKAKSAAIASRRPGRHDGCPAPLRPGGPAGPSRPGDRPTPVAAGPRSRTRSPLRRVRGGPGWRQSPRATPPPSGIP